MVSTKCQLRLDKGPDCSNFRARMSWVMCRTWSLLDSSEANGSKSKAMTIAQLEARTKCETESVKKSEV